MTDRAQWLAMAQCRTILASEDQSQTIKQCKNTKPKAMRGMMFDRNQCTPMHG